MPKIERDVFLSDTISRSAHKVHFMFGLVSLFSLLGRLYGIVLFFRMEIVLDTRYVNTDKIQES